MFYTGLVSVSFRDHSPGTIVKTAKKCNLSHIEWGSDLHAPCHDLSKVEQVAALQKAHEITCCSYGTYFRLGFTPLEELDSYIRAARVLGTNILRLWAGRKKAGDCSREEREHLFSQAKAAAAIAEAQGVILCLECHRRSYTETKEGALELMEAVDSPNFRMYWQPNPDITIEENLDYIRTLQKYITHIHVFHWTGTEKHPLAEGAAIWKCYLNALEGDHRLLLEFMPDDRLESLAAEANTLNHWTERERAHNYGNP